MSQEPIPVGSQRQLLFDEFWFDSQERIQLTLHRPERQEAALEIDRPWEDWGVHCSSVLLDDGRYRMWYRAAEGPMTDNKRATFRTCYAESRDGVKWEKPNLGFVSRKGSGENNILFTPDEFEGANASVIRDDNAPPDERYKMILRSRVITGYVSADGLRWRPVDTNPLITEGPVDSPNTLLWDDKRERYVIYLRGVDPSVPGPFKGGRRAIRRSESTDFFHWSQPELMLTADERDPVNLHLYTNAAIKYERAARAYFIFSMVLYPDRICPNAPFPGASDIQFAASRDGVHWERRFRKPYISPGLDERNWVDRNPTMGQGVVPTGPTELSMYHTEFNRSKYCHFRRATIRTDGFVSVEGPYTGWGEFTTHPLVFTGRQLELNYSTSGGGGIFVELQDGEGTPVPGFTLDDCEAIFGDKIEGIVRWKDGDDVGALAGRPVRLRVRLRDAHLYAFRFGA